MIDKNVRLLLQIINDAQPSAVKKFRNLEVTFGSQSYNITPPSRVKLSSISVN